MKYVAIISGLLLVALGAAGYWGAAPEARSMTALIPAFFGLPILLCGVWAALLPRHNALALHIAVTIGLLGALAATGRGIMSLLKLSSPDADVNVRALVFLGLMALICWLFFALCVRSFIAERRARKANGSYR